MAKATKTITVTNPITGEDYSFNTTMDVKAVRFLDTKNGDFIASHHRSISAALTGSNQTTAWNKFRRVVVDVETNEVVGPQPKAYEKGPEGAQEAPKRRVGNCPKCGMQVNLSKPCPMC